MTDRIADDLKRGQGYVADAMHLRLAAVGKKTLADHLSRVHGVQGATPLMSWTKDELESDHEDIHRRMAR